MMKILGALLLVGFTNSAIAHKFSTAYLDVSARDGQPVIVWQVALHDLAQARLLQGAFGSAVSWQQVLDSEASLSRYIRARLSFTADATACTLAPQHSDHWQLQQIQGEFYLQLAVQAKCSSAHGWQLTYRALFDTEHSHKALLSWQL
ncbi:MAG: hypothetical protein R3241_04950, partial [Rheinheimera sp.]|nr:hypothetical protein [Rheinheimera sp.]